MSDNPAAQQQKENTAAPLITQDELQKKVSQLVERALADETLRERLMQEPTSLMRENGIEIPDGIEAHVAADKDSISVQFLPQAGVEGELTESALSNVAGGGLRKSAGGTDSGATYLQFVFKLVA